MRNYDVTLNLVDSKQTVRIQAHTASEAEYQALANHPDASSCDEAVHVPKAAQKRAVQPVRV